MAERGSRSRPCGKALTPTVRSSLVATILGLLLPGQLLEVVVLKFGLLIERQSPQVHGLQISFL